MVTAPGSGIDPHISPQGAYIQVKRIAVVRNFSEDMLKELVKKNIENPFMGPEVINVLKLNIQLDGLK